MSKIYFKLGKDPHLKQAFVVALPMILLGHKLIIVKKKFKSIMIPQAQRPSFGHHMSKEIFVEADLPKQTST